MTSFSVDLDWLDTMAAQLGDVQGAIAGVRTSAGSYSPQDLGPDGGVWTELQSFGSAWAQGLQLIQGNISARVGMLRNASQSYQSMESAIVTATDGG